MLLQCMYPALVENRHAGFVAVLCVAVSILASALVM